MKMVRFAAITGLLAMLPAGCRRIEWRKPGVAWAIPFAGLLLSIALMPLLAPNFWHHHFGKVTAAWALAFLIPLVLFYGMGAAVANFVHALLAEYLPFVILLTALYVVAGGIYIRGSLTGTPLLNTAILAIGAVLASFMGTTGASMLLIRPLIARMRTAARWCTLWCSLSSSSPTRGAHSHRWAIRRCSWVFEGGGLQLDAAAHLAPSIVPRGRAAGHVLRAGYLAVQERQQPVACGAERAGPRSDWF